jgi:hypothetical protein
MGVRPVDRFGGETSPYVLANIASEDGEPWWG